MKPRMAFLRLKRTTLGFLFFILITPFTVIAIDSLKGNPPSAATQVTFTATPTIAPAQQPTIHLYSLPVYIQLPEEESYTEATAGQAVPEGTYIRTGDQGRAEVRFDDGTVTRIDKNSSIQVKQANAVPQKILIDVIDGRIWSRVKKLMGNESYTTTVDGLTATVRGTAFETRATETGGYTLVDEGAVQVQCSDSTSAVLVQNQQVEVSCDTDQTIQPVSVDESTLSDEWIQFNKAQDKKNPRPSSNIIKTPDTVNTKKIPSDQQNQHTREPSGGTQPDSRLIKESTLPTSPAVLPSSAPSSPTGVVQGAVDTVKDNVDSTVNSVNDTVNTVENTVEAIIPTSIPLPIGNTDKGKDKNKDKTNNGNANGREGGNGDCNGVGNPNCLGR